MRLANKSWPCFFIDMAAAVVPTLQGRLTVAPANYDTCATMPCCAAGRSAVHLGGRQGGWGRAAQSAAAQPAAYGEAGVNG